MDSRERIFTTIKERKLADRIPWTFDFGASRGFNPTLLYNYKKFMNIDVPIYDYFDYDIVLVLDPDKNSNKTRDDEKIGLEGLLGGVKFVSNGIRLEDYFNLEDIPKGGYLDAWGLYHHPWHIDPTFEVYYTPLKNIFDIKTIKEYPSPGIDIKSLEEARIDVEKIKSRKKVSVCYSGSVYEWTWNIRGQELFYEDLYDNPEIISAIVEKISNFDIKLATALQDIGVDILAFYDDFGAQDKLQISPKHWRQFIKPAWAKIWKKVKKKNKDTIIFLHSCGCIEEIIPDLIEIGLEVLHPIQPETMDVYEISKKYQKDLAIWGTISCQKTIPIGSPEDIDNEIKERVERMGKKGGFIISPANIMGPEVPLENINAFWEACKKYCIIK